MGGPVLCIMRILTVLHHVLGHKFYILVTAMTFMVFLGILFLQVFGIFMSQQISAQVTILNMDMNLWQLTICLNILNIATGYVAIL
jgi:hypothetical protein